MPDHRFVGLDAGKKLIATDVDVVLLCEPPHFRPIHLKAAIDAGKHVFAEKPVAVDAPGVRSVLATAEEAKKKNLNLVAGLCWRYRLRRVRDHEAHPRRRHRRHQDHPGNVPDRHPLAPPAQPDWTEMTYQLRNWYYFTWLSGDFNTEQHVHSLDKAAWAMHDQPPLRAWGIGGRQVRSEPKFGNIFDHHAVVYEYANGARVYSLLPPDRRLLQRRLRHVGRHQGRGDCHGKPAHTIKGATNWRYTGPEANMYDVEHQALVCRHPLGQDDQQRRLPCQEQHACSPRTDGELHRPGIDLGTGHQLAREAGPRRIQL